MLTKGNEAAGALQPGAAEKEFLEVPYKIKCQAVKETTLTLGEKVSVSK
jgi:hypothetical protein